MTDILNEDSGELIGPTFRYLPGMTASENVRVLADNFYIPQLRRNRRIWVYLPPNYDLSDDRYPVFYMQDGQNLFDEMYAAFGEWGVDETLDKLFEKTGRGFIVVGIENGRELRIGEYSPFAHPKHGGGEGEKYADFLSDTLKPFVDSNLRTLPEAENTVIGGSSMGGLLSLYAGIRHQKTFGKLCVFSPSLWFNAPQIFDFLYARPRRVGAKIYLLAGEKESAALVPNIRRAERILKAGGYTEDELRLVLRPDGTHSEHFWKTEFDRAVRFLFDLPS